MQAQSEKSSVIHISSLDSNLDNNINYNNISNNNIEEEIIFDSNTDYTNEWKKITKNNLTDEMKQINPADFNLIPQNILNDVIKDFTLKEKINICKSLANKIENESEKKKNILNLKLSDKPLVTLTKIDNFIVENNLKNNKNWFYCLVH